MKTLNAVFHRRCSLVLACVAAAFMLTAGVATAQPSTGRLLSRDHIARLGLKRAWFAQVQLDGSRSKVERAIVSGNQMFVLTSAGTLHALNSETGETMWVTPFGNPELPSMGPATNEKRVAALNGSMLYVMDRADGKTAIIRHAGGVPAAPPAMSRTYCFVPMVTGRIEGYPVEDEKLQPWFFQSQGRAMVAPLATDSCVVWSTDSGHIYVGNSTAPGVRFRLETGSEIVASPASRGPTIYVGTVAGELIAVDESTSSQPWRFASGYPILRAPAAVGGRIFVNSTRPALFAVDSATGAAQWSVPKMTQFAAASRERVYAMDTLGALVVLDAANGAVIGRMPTDGNSKALVNDQTDRLYLVSATGLVQCMHELGADQPLYHNPLPEAKPAVDVAQPIPAATPAPAETPAATPAVPAADTNPFGEIPARPADENPFGELGRGSGGAPPAGAGRGGGGGDNPLDR